MIASYVPVMPHPHFEPVAWWYTRKQIGRFLRERYAVPEVLPAKLLTLVSRLGALEESGLLVESSQHPATVSNDPHSVGPDGLEPPIVPR